MNTIDKAPLRKLLAVFAHPDDESFICGGTLAKYASEGVDITLVSATRGEMGRRMGNPSYLNRESIAAAREMELRQAWASGTSISWIFATRRLSLLMLIT